MANLLPNDDEVRGRIEQVKGTVKEHIGRAKDDPVLEEEGADQRAGGELEAGLGRARRKVGEALNDLGEKINK